MRLDCPLCRSSRLEWLARPGRTPVHQHITFATAEEARACPRGEMVLALCGACGFVFNASFESALVGYSPRYENTQEHSPSFARYLDEVIDDLTRRHALSGKTIVEIGCGQGTWLARLCSAAGATGVGFDPSVDRARSPAAPGLTFVAADYDAAHPLAGGDLVCARHVIEHVPDPVDLIRAVAGATGARECTLCIETPRLEWILERRAYWDVFYEHCSYFAMPVLATLVGEHGFGVTRHRATFGAQYQWLEAERGAPAPDAGDRDRRALDHLGRGAAAFRDNWHEWQVAWRDRVRDLAAEGPSVVWGAGAKGVTALNLLDPDGTAFVAAVDLNPRKQGRYVPGTGHPIVAPVDPRALGARTVLIVNGNYADEIRGVLRDLGVQAACVVLDGP